MTGEVVVKDYVAVSTAAAYWADLQDQFQNCLYPSLIYMTKYLNMDVHFAALIKSYAPLTFTLHSTLGFIVLSSSFF